MLLKVILITNQTVLKWFWNVFMIILQNSKFMIESDWHFSLKPRRQWKFETYNAYCKFTIVMYAMGCATLIFYWQIPLTKRKQLLKAMNAISFYRLVVGSWEKGVKKSFHHFFPRRQVICWDPFNLRLIIVPIVF